MTDILLTAVIPLLMCVVLLWGSRWGEPQGSFFGKDYTGIIKGMCCIVVILVHVTAPHCNPLQDAIGSFAYIGVTFFFMVSAYGMSLAAERKPDYLQSFWRNRLCSLLVPMLTCNVIGFVLANLSNRGG